MIAKTMTYTDYDGVERKETFYFNLTKAELMDMQLSSQGGLDSLLQRMIDAKDVPELANMFKELIKRSYGVKSADGRRLMKSEALTQEFLETEAYSDLYMELITNTETAAAFVNGIVPKVEPNPIPPAVQ